MKQETKCYCGHTTYCDCGPKQEINYSEQEVYNLLLKYQNEYIYANNENGLKYWFEKIKKK